MHAHNILTLYLTKICRSLFSVEQMLLRRSHKAQVNVKDLLKDVLKLFHANEHSDMPHVNSRKVIYLTRSYALL